MNLQPLEDRIIVKPIEEKQEGLIVIPEIAKERSVYGKVLAIGPGKCMATKVGELYGEEVKNRTFQDMNVSVGDKVLFGKYSGTEVEVNGEQVFIMRQSDVLAIVK